MRRFKIKETTSGKEYIVRMPDNDNDDEGRLSSCVSAFEKFANRCPAMCDGAKLRQYDADTRGMNWAEYIKIGKRFIVERMQ